MQLLQVDDVWTVYYQNRPYVALIEATSRQEAEVQLAELLGLSQQAGAIRDAVATDEGGRTDAPSVSGELTFRVQR